MKGPLVSVAVATYNCSSFIVETLESIKAQTYPNIELVISDDNSSDDTVARCRQWLAENAARFARTELVTSPVNTGVVGCGNRALQALQGTWIKILGGDDLLLPRCIESNMEIAEKYPDTDLIVSKMVRFDSKSGKDLDILPAHDIPSKDGAAQLKGILKGNYIKTPATFIRKSIAEKLGGYDARFPMFEDDPLWLKANLAGHYFRENPEVLVKYRIHENSLSNSTERFVHPLFYPSFKRFKLEVICPILKQKGMYRDLIYIKTRIWLTDRVLRKGNNLKDRRNLAERFILKGINLLRS